MSVITLPQIRRQRLLAGLSVRGLAKAAGVSYQTITRLENGRHAGELTLQCLTQIATALDVTAAQLLEDTTTESAPATTGARLNFAQVRLLHHIATNPRAMATLSKTQRELVLPGLVRDGLVTVSEGEVELHQDVRFSVTGE